MPPPDDDTQHANEEALKRMTREAKEADPDAEVVRLPEEGEEDEEPAPRETPEQTESRNDRRRNRYREAREEAAAAKRESADLKTRLAALESRYQAPMPQQAPPPAAPQEDPHEKRATAVQKEMQDLQRDWDKVSQARGADGKALATEEDRQRYQGRWYELNRRQQEIIVEQTAERMAAARGGYDPSAAATQAALEARYLDIVRHPDSKRLLAYANAEWARETLANRKAESVELMDEVMERTRIACGIKKSPAPTPTAKARFSGIGAGARGAAVSNESGAGVRVLTKAEKIMARAAYRGAGLSEPQIYQKWAMNQQKRSAKT